jgi:hypothetical protein
MGLDLHLLRLSKPMLEAKDVYEEEDLDCYRSCPVEGCDLPRTLINRFAQLVTINRQCWNMEAIYQAFKAQYPDQYPHDTKPATVDFYPCGGHYGPNSISYTWEDYDRPCLIKLEGWSANDLDAYLTLEPTPTYVWDMAEVDYQRKGLTDEGWEILPDNCTYCMDYDLVQALTKEGLSTSFLENWIEGETALYPSW